MKTANYRDEHVDVRISAEGRRLFGQSMSLIEARQWHAQSQDIEMYYAAGAVIAATADLKHPNRVI